MTHKFETETFEDQLDELLALQARATRRDCDAGACQTPRDFRAAAEAEAELEAAQRAFLRRWDMTSAWRDEHGTYTRQ